MMNVKINLYVGWGMKGGRFYHRHEVGSIKEKMSSPVDSTGNKGVMVDVRENKSGNEKRGGLAQNFRWGKIYPCF